MRWRRTGRDDSGLEDRRGQSPRGGMRFPGGAVGKGAGGLGVVGVIVVLLVAFLGGGSGGGGFDIGPSLDRSQRIPRPPRTRWRTGPIPMRT